MEKIDSTISNWIAKDGSSTKRVIFYLTYTPIADNPPFWDNPELCLRTRDIPGTDKSMILASAPINKIREIAEIDQVISINSR